MAGKFVFILLLLVDAAVKSTGDTEVWGSPEPVHTSVGQDVILPCHLEPPFDVRDLIVEWRLNKDLVHVYRHRRDDPNLQDERFKHRTSLFHDEMSKGNISLKLSSVNKTDAGSYTCYVPTLHSQVKTGYITLSVGDPEVWGSPEPVHTSVGQDVILPCHLEPPFDVRDLTVEWRLNKTLVHLYRHRRDDPNHQDERFKHRTSLFRDEISKGNISLKLSSVNKTDAGNYTCYVPKLHSQVKRGYIMLSVEDEFNTPEPRVYSTPAPAPASGDKNKDPSHQQQGLGPGSITAIVLSIVFVIVIIAALLGKKYGINRRCRNRRGEERRPRNDPMENAGLRNANNDEL